MKYVKLFNEKYNLEGDNFYYIIHMDKSIDKFNVALKKLDIFDTFYAYLDEDDIPINDIVYLIFDENSFYLEENIENHFYLSTENRGDIYVNDYEVSANKYNL